MRGCESRWRRGSLSSRNVRIVSVQDVRTSSSGLLDHQRRSSRDSCGVRGRASASTRSAQRCDLRSPRTPDGRTRGSRDELARPPAERHRAQRLLSLAGRARSDAERSLILLRTGQGRVACHRMSACMSAPESARCQPTVSGGVDRGVGDTGKTHFADGLPGPHGCAASFR